MTKPSFLEKLKGKNLHLVGFLGLEGWAMADFLIKKGFENITFHDFTQEKEIFQKFKKTHPGFSEKKIKEAFEKIKKLKKVCLKNNYLKDIEKAEAIFLPQSWFLYKENKPLFSLKGKTPFYGILNFYLELALAQIIGVTGSQGKTTTCRLIYHILRYAKKKKEIEGKVYYGGNDRSACQSLEKIDQMRGNDFLILEISHRQLMFDIKKSPKIAVILNITKNHLDETGSFENYIKLKEKIAKYQTKNDFLILNKEDSVLKKLSKNKKSKIIFFSRKEKIDIEEKKLPLLGKHGKEDILAAKKVAEIVGVSKEAIKKAILSFPPPKNCLEFLKEKRGIEYWNDLASTTPEATKEAIEFLSSQGKEIILICGGEDKGMEIKKLASIIERKVKKAIFLPGSGTKKLAFLIKNQEKIMKVKTLKEALNKAVSFKNKNKKIAILISPAFAFFGSYFGKRKDILRIIKRL